MHYSREADFGYFWMTNFHRSQIQFMFINVNVGSSDETIRCICKTKNRDNRKHFYSIYNKRCILVL